MMTTPLERVLGCTNCPFSEVFGSSPTCNRTGAEIRFFDTAATCPEDRWSKVKLAGSAAPPATKRTRARSFWKTMGLALQAGKVIASGRASEEDIATRMASCSSCPFKRTNALGEEYCGDCGCGTNRWSVLDVKLTYKELPCPQGRPGFYAG